MMMSSGKEDPGELLQELEALSSTLYESHTRRTASLALSRDSLGPAPAPARPRARRLSLSPWRSRPPPSQPSQLPSQPSQLPSQPPPSQAVGESSGSGWKKWKAVRAVAHIGMKKVGCLLSVEVVAVQGLPASMNGLRLSVCLRKKESKDGAVHTMPSRVSHGHADFEETLFLRSRLYSSSSSSIKFEPRPFWVYAFAVDAPDLDLGRSPVDLARLVQDSVAHSRRSWDVSFPLSGKASGALLLLKLGFQIMDNDAALSIYAAPLSSPSFPRKQSKNSFSVPSPKQPAPAPAPHKDIDDFHLDDNNNKPAPPQQQPDLDPLPDFDVIDRGVELEKAGDNHKAEAEEEESEKSSGEKSVVKEMDSVHVARLTELDSIAQQIKALESSMAGDDNESGSQRLEAEEESVTKEFLQMLEEEEYLAENKAEEPELGKNLGSVVQTRDGGYLASINTNLAMQLSKPYMVLLEDSNEDNALELLQSLSTPEMEDLAGKTAEQIAFEGIAAAVINGRKRAEVASSSAGRAIASAKAAAAAMAWGRAERAATGIWNLRVPAVGPGQLVAEAMPRIEAMAVEGVRVQAGAGEGEAPFEVGPTRGRRKREAVGVEEWEKGRAAVAVGVQVRDPLRGMEPVGGPMLALILAREDPHRTGMLSLDSLHVGGLTADKDTRSAINSAAKCKTAAAAATPNKKDVLWSLSSRVMADMWLTTIRNPDVNLAPSS